MFKSKITISYLRTWKADLSKDRPNEAIVLYVLEVEVLAPVVVLKIDRAIARVAAVVVAEVELVTVVVVMAHPIILLLSNVVMAVVVAQWRRRVALVDRAVVGLKLHHVDRIVVVVTIALTAEPLTMMVLRVLSTKPTVPDVMVINVIRVNMKLISYPLPNAD